MIQKIELGKKVKLIFKLKGLNKPWKAGGFNSIYATIKTPGTEDWFHCPFDEKGFPDSRLEALFDLFKNSEENLWSGRIHNVVIEDDVIKEIILDGLHETAA